MKEQTEKQKFIHGLAEYLVGNQVEQSIGLQLGRDSAKQWAKLRGLTPLFGHPTVKEAERTLTEFLK